MWVELATDKLIQTSNQNLHQLKIIPLFFCFHKKEKYIQEKEIVIMKNMEEKKENEKTCSCGKKHLII